MKKIMTFLSAGVLMITLCMGFVACNEPKGPEQPDVPEVIGMAPVAGTDIPDEVSVFFEEYLPRTNRSLLSPVEFNFGDVAPLDPVCLVVNSIDEFETIAPLSAELPEIDFKNHTLIVGQHPMGDPGHRLVDQGIVTEPDVMILNLIYERLGGGTPAIETTFYYWALYPKLPQKQITVKIYNQ